MEYNRNWWEDINKVDVWGGKVPSNVESKIKKEAIWYLELNRPPKSQLTNEQFYELVKKVWEFLSKITSEKIKLKENFDKLKDEVGLSTSRKVDKVKWEVEKSRELKENIYYLSNVLLSYREEILDSKHWISQSWYNRGEKVKVANSIAKTVEELNNLVKSNWEVTEKQVIDILVKNLESIFFQVEISPKFIDWQDKLKKWFREIAIREIRENLWSEQLKAIFNREFKKEIEEWVEKIDSDKINEIENKAEKQIEKFSTEIRKKAVEDYNKRQLELNVMWINSVEDLEWVMKVSVKKMIVWELLVEKAISKFEDKDIPDHKRWLWQRYWNTFDPQDDIMTLSDASANEILSFIAYDLTSMILAWGIAWMAWRIALKWWLWLASSVWWLKNVVSVVNWVKVIDTTTKLWKAAKVAWVVWRMWVEWITFTAAFEGIRNKKWFLDMASDELTKQIILNSLMFGTFRYMDKVWLQNYSKLLKFAKKHPFYNWLARQWLAAPAILTAMTMWADKMTSDELRESKEYLKEFIMLWVMAWILHMIPNGKWKVRIEWPEWKNIWEIDVNTWKAEIGMWWGKKLETEIPVEKLPTTIRKNPARLEANRTEAKRQEKVEKEAREERERLEENLNNSKSKDIVEEKSIIDKDYTIRDKVDKITTEKWSVYTFLSDWTTQRFKTKTWEKNEAMDLLIFFNPWTKLDTLLAGLHNQMAWIETTVRALNKSNWKRIETTKEAIEAEKSWDLILAVINVTDNVTIWFVEATTIPRNWLHIFDANYSNWNYVKHIWNKVIKIDYKLETKVEQTENLPVRWKEQHYDFESEARPVTEANNALNVMKNWDVAILWTKLEWNHLEVTRTNEWTFRVQKVESWKKVWDSVIVEWKIKIKESKDSNFNVPEIVINWEHYWNIKEVKIKTWEEVKLEIKDEWFTTIKPNPARVEARAKAELEAKNARIEELKKVEEEARIERERLDKAFDAMVRKNDDFVKNENKWRVEETKAIEEARKIEEQRKLDEAIKKEEEVKKAREEAERRVIEDQSLWKWFKEWSWYGFRWSPFVYANQEIDNINSKIDKSLVDLWEIEQDSEEQIKQEQIPAKIKEPTLETKPTPKSKTEPTPVKPEIPKPAETQQPAPTEQAKPETPEVQTTKIDWLTLFKAVTRLNSDEFVDKAFDMWSHKHFGYEWRSWFEENFDDKDDATIYLDNGKIAIKFDKNWNYETYKQKTYIDEFAIWWTTLEKEYDKQKSWKIDFSKKVNLDELLK